MERHYVLHFQWFWPISCISLYFSPTLQLRKLQQRCWVTDKSHTANRWQSQAVNSICGALEFFSSSKSSNRFFYHFLFLSFTPITTLLNQTKADPSLKSAHFPGYCRKNKDWRNRQLSQQNAYCAEPQNPHQKARGWMVKDFSCRGPSFVSSTHIRWLTTVFNYSPRKSNTLF